MSKNFAKRSAKFMLFLILSLFIVGGIAPQHVQSQSPAATQAATQAANQAATQDQYWPTTAWRVSMPEEQGMDSKLLAQMLDSVKEQQLTLHSLLVIRHGAIVSETYWGPYGKENIHQLYSVTKSFIATLIGIAKDKGYIDDLEHHVVDYFPDKTFENQDATKQAMTLDNVLSMRAGLDWTEGNFEAYGQLYRSRDWVKYMMDLPMRDKPGVLFNYCSGCSHLLSAIVQQSTKMNTEEFAQKMLFGPLGISNLRWDVDSAGIPNGGWGLHLAPRDMAKLGYLYLHHGVWDGQQIVSADWVKTATQKHTDTDSELGYGYQWWIYPDYEAYIALGLAGQTIFVVPELDLIVVTTADMPNHDSIFDLIDKYIVPAAKKP